MSVPAPPTPKQPGAPEQPDTGAGDQATGPPSRREAVRAVAARLRAAGIDQAALDARLLVAAALAVDQARLLAEGDAPLSADEAATLARLADRRLTREPVSRIVGRRWFHGHELEIGPATLDPRPETETLVDGVLARLAGWPSGAIAGGGPRILDLGTGSGAILVALLAVLPTATGVGTDIDPRALDLAWRNAVRLGVASRMELRNGPWLTCVQGETFDVVVSNPPYIPRQDIAALEPEVARFDPPTALDGGADGLDCYRAIAEHVGAALAADGLLVVEVGAGQARDVAALLSSHGLDVEPDSDLWHDLNGHVRCVAARSRHPEYGN